MIDIPSAFAAGYAEARSKFHAAASARGLPLERHLHPTARGAQDEELSVDLAVLGDANAKALLVILSGMHGVEGFCGSGCQVALLHDEAFLQAARRSGAAILFCHAVNPYGFSHLRRTNEDNVDLNRNFRDFDRPCESNAAYARLHPLLIPEHWPPDAANTSSLRALAAAQGITRLQATISSGQSDFPDGLFFAGRAPAWSNTVLRGVLERYGSDRARLGWIDIHTGLGPWGHGEKIHSGPDDAAMIARARAWYGSDVTSFYDGTSASAEVTGVSYQAALDTCPQAEYTGIGLEFGTKPLLDVLQALRGDQWLANHPDSGAPLRTEIKRRMREAFCDDSVEWQSIVYGQTRVAAMQALRALATPVRQV
jgi:predicted deacylase